MIDCEYSTISLYNSTNLQMYNSDDILLSCGKCQPYSNNYLQNQEFNLLCNITHPTSPHHLSKYGKTVLVFLIFIVVLLLLGIASIYRCYKKPFHIYSQNHYYSTFTSLINEGCSQGCSLIKERKFFLEN